MTTTFLNEMVIFLSACDFFEMMDEILRDMRPSAEGSPRTAACSIS